VVAQTDVRVSPKVARRQIRVRNPGGDAERLARSHRTDRRENPLGRTEASVPKLTQVGEVRILRRSGELLLRNSAN